MLLKDKVIVVTGGTGILGGAFVRGIAAEGAIVGILGRNMMAASQRVNQIREMGGKAIALQADVLDEMELIDAKNKILEQFQRIDGLVNAAGGNMPEGVVDPNDNIFKMDMAGMKKVNDLNLWGTIIPTQVFGEEISKSDSGSVVNISSMSSQQAITKVLGYSLGKAGIDCYTKWMATEIALRYGDRVRVNAIAPGFFLTEQNRALLTNSDGSFTQRGSRVIQNTPMGRLGVPSELEGALIWLLSSNSMFVTGAIINVDGGFSVFSGV